MNTSEINDALSFRPLEDWRAQDRRREKWYGIGLLLAFVFMLCVGLSLCDKKEIPRNIEGYGLMSLLAFPWAVFALVFSLWKRSEIESLPLDCPVCGAGIGESHFTGCQLEECPFCRGQLVGCGCIHTVLNLTPAESECVETYGDDFVEPLKTIIARWEATLEEKGRIPYCPERLIAEFAARVGEKPKLEGVAIKADVAAVIFKTNDGRAIRVNFNRTKRGWLMEDV